MPLLIAHATALASTILGVIRHQPPRPTSICLPPALLCCAVPKRPLLGLKSFRHLFAGNYAWWFFLGRAGHFLQALEFSHRLLRGSDRRLPSPCHRQYGVRNDVCPDLLGPGHRWCLCFDFQVRI